MRLAHFEVSLKAHKDFRSTLLKGNNKQKLVCHHTEKEREMGRERERGRERGEARAPNEQSTKQTNEQNRKKMK